MTTCQTNNCRIQLGSRRYCSKVGQIDLCK